MEPGKFTTSFTRDLHLFLSQAKSAASWNFSQHAKFLQSQHFSIMRNSQVGGPPLVGCRQLLIQYIRSYRPHRRQFLHPQSEDAPCCDDRDPLIVVCFLYSATNQHAEICSTTFYVIVIQMLRVSYEIHVSQRYKIFSKSALILKKIYMIIFGDRDRVVGITTR
jgi:hypothetical protein